jgi:hypothetical protein
MGLRNPIHATRVSLKHGLATESECMEYSRLLVQQHGTALKMHIGTRGCLVLKIGKVGRREVWESGHRIMLWAMSGPPPNGEHNVVAHRCNYTSCLLPAHLYYASQKENMQLDNEGLKRAVLARWQEDWRYSSPHGAGREQTALPRACGKQLVEAEVGPAAGSKGMRKC